MLGPPQTLKAAAKPLTANANAKTATLMVFVMGNDSSSNVFLSRVSQHQLPTRAASPEIALTIVRRPRDW